MFERYTEEARRVVFFAREEASAYGSSSIETEHLLLGLTREDPQTRNILGASAEAVVRERVESARTQPREALPISVDLPFSHESKRVLAYAAEEAELRRDRMIGCQGGSRASSAKITDGDFGATGTPSGTCRSGL